MWARRGAEGDQMTLFVEAFGTNGTRAERCDG